MRVEFEQADQLGGGGVVIADESGAILGVDVLYHSHPFSIFRFMEDVIPRPFKREYNQSGLGPKGHK